MILRRQRRGSLALTVSSLFTAGFTAAFGFAAAIGFAGCQRGDDDGLGLDRAKTTAPLLDHLTDADALLRVIGQPGGAVSDKLGPRSFDLARIYELSQARSTDRVEQVWHFDSDGKNGFHVVHELGHPAAVASAPKGDNADAPVDKVDTSAQGMEAVATGGKVYLRPRYGRFVERRAEPGELDRLRDLAEQQLADDLEVLRAWLSITDGGNEKLMDRSVRILELSKSASPRKLEASDDPRQGWRAGVKVSELKGELRLDAQTGVPLAGQVEARYEIPREGGPVSAHLSLRLVPRPPRPVVPPADAQANPVRTHPVVERNQLLQGLAPPVGTQAARTP